MAKTKTTSRMVGRDLRENAEGGGFAKAAQGKHLRHVKQLRSYEEDDNDDVDDDSNLSRENDDNDDDDNEDNAVGFASAQGKYLRHVKQLRSQSTAQKQHSNPSRGNDDADEEDYDDDDGVLLEDEEDDDDDEDSILSPGNDDSDDDDNEGNAVGFASAQGKQLRNVKQLRSQSTAQTQHSNLSRDNDDDDDDEEDDEEDQRYNRGGKPRGKKYPFVVPIEVGKPTILEGVLVRILPLLQLHCSSADDGNSVPNTQAIPCNIRSLNLARITCEDENSNMVVKLRKEVAQEEACSVLDGIIHVVLSSFKCKGSDDDNDNNDNDDEGNTSSIPMQSVLSADSSEHFAIPLTIQILNDALVWLMVGHDKEEFLLDDELTISDGVKKYLELLSKKVPMDMNVDHLTQFIQEHEWKNADWQGGEIQGLVTNLIWNRGQSPLLPAFNSVSAVSDGYRLQRFIHENLAKQTKIVINIIDGIHRIAALDCVLVGYHHYPSNKSKHDNDNIDAYARLFPHRNKTVSLAMYILPTFKTKDDIRGLISQYQELSTKIQQKNANFTPHTIREIIFHEMTRLASETTVPYLWDCLGILYSVIRDVSCQDVYMATLKGGIREDSELEGTFLSELNTFLSGRDYMKKKYNLLESYISCWVERMSDSIINVILANPRHCSQLGLDDTTKEITHLQRMFRRGVRGSVSYAREEYFLFHGGDSNFRMSSFFQKWNDMEKVALAMTDGVQSQPFNGVRYEYRFHTIDDKKIPAQIYILSQILLWSRFSKNDYNHLIDLFSNNNAMVYYQIRPGNQLDASRWTMNFYFNVIESVYYSYKPWKSGYFVLNHTFPIQNNPQQVIYLCLLGSAIKTCSDFFEKLGVNALWDQNKYYTDQDVDVSVDERERLKQFWKVLLNIKGVLDDVISRSSKQTLIPNLDTFLTTSHIFRMSKSTENSPNKKSWLSDHLQRHFGHLGVIGFTTRAKTNKQKSVLDQVLKGDGDNTADPRGREKKFSYIIGLISHDTNTALIEEHVDKNLFLPEDDNSLYENFRKLQQRLSKEVVSTTDSEDGSDREDGSDSEDGVSPGATTAGNKKRKKGKSKTTTSGKKKRKTEKKKRGKSKSKTKKKGAGKNKRKSKSETKKKGKSTMKPPQGDNAGENRDNRKRKDAPNPNSDATDNHQGTSSHQANNDGPVVVAGVNPQGGSTSTNNVGTTAAAAAKKSPPGSLSTIHDDIISTTGVTTRDEGEEEDIFTRRDEGEEEDNFLTTAKNPHDVQVLSQLFEIMFDYRGIRGSMESASNDSDIQNNIRNIDELLTRFASLEFDENNTSEALCTVCLEPCVRNEALLSHLCTEHMRQLIRQNQKSDEAPVVRAVVQMRQQDDLEQHGRYLAQTRRGARGHVDNDDFAPVDGGNNAFDLSFMEFMDEITELQGGEQFSDAAVQFSDAAFHIAQSCCCCGGILDGFARNVHEFMQENTHIMIDNYHQSSTPDYVEICTLCMERVRSGN